MPKLGIVLVLAAALHAAAAAPAVQAAVDGGTARMGGASPPLHDGGHAEDSPPGGPAAAGLGPVAAASEADHSVRWVEQDASAAGGRCDTACERVGMLPITDDLGHTLCAWREKAYVAARYRYMYYSGAHCPAPAAGSSGRLGAACPVGAAA